jgi:hypothetical protein
VEVLIFIFRGNRQKIQRLEKLVDRLLTAPTGVQSDLPSYDELEHSHKPEALKFKLVEVFDNQYLIWRGLLTLESIGLAYMETLAMIKLHGKRDA